MKLSARTITRLRLHINGDGDNFELGGKYRSGPKLVSLFNEFGFNDAYGEGFPSRWAYTEKSLNLLNGQPEMVELFRTVFDRLEYEADNHFYSLVLDDINKYLQRDGYKIKSSNGIISVLSEDANLVAFEVPKIDSIVSSEYIKDNITKCSSKLREGDYRGAITNARSLCEDVLFEIEKKITDKDAKYDGDLPKLFKNVKTLLKMDAGQGKGNNAIVQLLRGLTTIVNGLATMSSSFADRHGGENEKSQKHHAELAVNAANTLCTYVTASYMKQHPENKSSP